MKFYVVDGGGRTERRSVKAYPRLATARGVATYLTWHQGARNVAIYEVDLDERTVTEVGQ